LCRSVYSPTPKLVIQTRIQQSIANGGPRPYPTPYPAQHGDIEWLIGPGKALDPDKNFIIVLDQLGNGLSSSPSNTPSPSPGSGRGGIRDATPTISSPFSAPGSWTIWVAARDLTAVSRAPWAQSKPGPRSWRGRRTSTSRRRTSRPMPHAFLVLASRRFRPSGPRHGLRSTCQSRSHELSTFGEATATTGIAATCDKMFIQSSRRHGRTTHRAGRFCPAFCILKALATDGWRSAMSPRSSRH